MAAVVYVPIHIQCTWPETFREIGFRKHQSDTFLDCPVESFSYTIFAVMFQYWYIQCICLQIGEPQELFGHFASLIVVVVVDALDFLDSMQF